MAAALVKVSRAAGTALRIVREAALEEHALARHAVKVRRLHPVAAVGIRVLPAPVVEDDEENVWTFRSFRSRGEGCAKKNAEDEKVFHGRRGNVAPACKFRGSQSRAS